MQVTINGEARQLQAAASLRQMLEALQLGDKRVAVELNGAIVPRSRHDSVALADGDEVLIVQAIGGG